MKKAVQQHQRRRGSHVTGVITNIETGASRQVERYLYPTGSKMEVIGAIERAEIFELGDVLAPFQVIVDSLALDAISEVFGADLVYWCESRQAAERIVSELEPGKIFFLKGSFCISEECSVTIYHPEYSPVPNNEFESIHRAINVNYKRSC